MLFRSGYSKEKREIIRESAFDTKIKKPGLNFIPGLALTGVRITGPGRLQILGGISRSPYLNANRRSSPFLVGSNFRQQNFKYFALFELSICHCDICINVIGGK